MRHLYNSYTCSPASNWPISVSLYQLTGLPLIFFHYSPHLALMLFFPWMAHHIIYGVHILSVQAGTQQPGQQPIIIHSPHTVIPGPFTSPIASVSPGTFPKVGEHLAHIYHLHLPSHQVRHLPCKLPIMGLLVRSAHALTSKTSM